MFEDPKEYKVLSQCGSRREGEPLAGGQRDSRHLWRSSLARLIGGWSVCVLGKKMLSGPVTVHIDHDIPVLT